jgi:hypothetical protein
MSGRGQALLVMNHPAKPGGLPRAGTRAIRRIAPQGSISPDDRCGLTANVALAGHKPGGLLVGAVESVRAGRREAPQCSTVSQKALP